jgi:hypothetical protein
LPTLPPDDRGFGYEPSWQLGDEPTIMTPTIGTTILWAVVAAIAIVGIGVVYRRYVAAARVGRNSNASKSDSPDEAQPLSESVYEVALNCRIGGHAYAPFDTGWRCATCGNYVSRREGELFGPAEEGRTERRRSDREAGPR